MLILVNVVQEWDARDDDSCNAAGIKILIKILLKLRAKISPQKASIPLSLRRQVLHDQLLLNPPRAGRQQE